MDTANLYVIGIFLFIHTKRRTNVVLYPDIRKTVVLLIICDGPKKWDNLVVIS